jgi:hypothetical protein
MQSIIGHFPFKSEDNTEPEPSPPWILATGKWNDDGVWDDNATWNDGV